MLIRFGTNGFTVSKHTPEEIGMQQDTSKPFTVEVRASYFHILYLPFFATGKECVLLFPDGNRYHVPDAYKAAAVSLASKGKTPWYSFAGLILIPLLFIGSNLISNLNFRSNQEHIASETQAKNDEAYKTAVSQIEKPLNGDFYTVKVKEGDVEKVLLLRIDSSDAEKIYLSDKSLKYSVDQYAELHQIAGVFADTAVHSAQVILDKKTLKATVGKNGEEIYQSFAGGKTLAFSFGWFDPGPEISSNLSPDLVSGAVTKLSFSFYNAKGKVIKIIPKNNVKQIQTACPLAASQFDDFEIRFIPGDERTADLGIVFQEEGSGKIYTYFARVFNGTVVFQPMRA